MLQTGKLPFFKDWLGLTKIEEEAVKRHSPIMRGFAGRSVKMRRDEPDAMCAISSISLVQHAWNRFANVSFSGNTEMEEAAMANWVECKPYGGPDGTTIFVNLVQVVSLTGDNRATVVRYAGHPDSEFVIEGSPQELLGKAPSAG